MLSIGTAQATYSNATIICTWKIKRWFSLDMPKKKNGSLQGSLASSPGSTHWGVRNWRGKGFTSCTATHLSIEAKP